MYTKEWMTIPVLPCISLDETMEYWKNLGFSQTYYQNKPYQYGVVERNGYELHFARVKGMQPEESYNGCLVMVTNVEQVHKEFSHNLKNHYGKVANSGIPRISKIRPGSTRFTLTDPSGNSVIFINFGKEDEESYNLSNKEGLTTLQRKIALAVRFRDFKNDNEAASKTLDAGLKRPEGENAIDIAEALLIRAELASDMEDKSTENNCYAHLKKLILSDEEIIKLKRKLSLPDKINGFLQ